MLRRLKDIIWLIISLKCALKGNQVYKIYNGGLMEEQRVTEGREESLRTLGYVIF